MQEDSLLTSVAPKTTRVEEQVYLLMQCPAVATRSGPTRVPEQDPQVIWPAKRSPLGQRYREPRVPQLRQTLPLFGPTNMQSRPGERRGGGGGTEHLAL